MYDVLEALAISQRNIERQIEILESKVGNLHRLEDAASLIDLYNQIDLDNKLYQVKINDLKEEVFSSAQQRLILAWILGEISEEDMLMEVGKKENYPIFFDNYIRRFIDEMAVERNDSLRVASSQLFATKFPFSRWSDVNEYLYTQSLLNLKKYDMVKQTILSDDDISPTLAYLYAKIMLSAEFRKNSDSGNKELLKQAEKMLISSEFPSDKQTIDVIYQRWSEKYWENRMTLLHSRIIYYLIIADYGLWGDEDIITDLLDSENKIWTKGLRAIQSIKFANNDYGEVAEHNYWLGRFNILLRSEENKLRAAEYFLDCLIAGAPRKRFDESALRYLQYIHRTLHIEQDLMSWGRGIKNYNGPVFTDVTEATGLSGNNFRRIAIGDYDNDGRADLLFNGHRLYRNKGEMRFGETTEQAGIVNHSFTGGLWADFDKDGNLDFVALSSSSEPPGNTLFRNLGNGTFEASNDIFGDINDNSPSEGAAWVDIRMRGYPSLYVANYERWGEPRQSGFQDFFWFNEGGYFTDKTREFGLLAPNYTTDPGLAGRGVAPADYNNDGKQSIFVSNYKLGRNYLWDREKDQFTDNAAFYQLAGNKQNGYYGHTIGVDWGDYNNNGLLDLFIANLAHPRFLDFSDISMLMRNDGLRTRTIGDTIITYHQFTDVTQEAGITYDELHSDPTWFDANNDGYLDLYITSVYENDRSYLYLNNKDGTFTDITWLAGVRVYNGWGNAVADLNGNGRLDLVVGSGNGVRIFQNVTDNDYKSVSYKPYWQDDKIKLSCRNEWHSELPNSPVFGCKVIVRIKRKDGDIFTIMRELNGGKGTTSQNSQYLHFGIGEGELLEHKVWYPDE